MERSLQGILLVILATFLLATVDTSNKFLVQRLPVFEIVWVRFLVFTAVAIRMGWRDGLRRQLRSQRPLLQLVRGSLLVASMVCMTLAFRYLLLAEVQAIFSVAPLMVVALSALFLREAVGLQTWAAVAIGFLGVLLIVQPGFVVMHWSVVLPIGAAGFFAAYQILVKLVARHDRSSTTLLYTAIAGAILMSAIGPFVWVWPTPFEWGLLMASGLIGSVAHYIFIRALEAAPASILQPFTYLQMVAGAGYGIWLFAEVPGVWMIVGAALVAVGGIYATWQRIQSPR